MKIFYIMVIGYVVVFRVENICRLIEINLVSSLIYLYYSSLYYKDFLDKLLCCYMKLRWLLYNIKKSLIKG